MRVAIIGRTETLYSTMEYLASIGHEICLIVTAKEAPEYRKTAEDFRGYAEEFRIPFFSTAKISNVLADIKKLGRIDIAVSMNYVGIIPQEVIDAFSLGILNAHGGDLPRYRGNACQAWAILNGEGRVGLCIHHMVGGELDSGDIIEREYFPLETNTKITEVLKWMESRVPILFSQALDALGSNPDFILEKQSRDPSKALRCYPRIPEDGRIHWSDSSKKILRLINASNKPYGGAFCYYNEMKVIIWDAELIYGDENFVAIPGQVSSINTSSIDVIAGDNEKLRIKEVEVDGEIYSPDKIIRTIRARLF